MRPLAVPDGADSAPLAVLAPVVEAHHSMDARTLSPARDTAGATVTRLASAAS